MKAVIKTPDPSLIYSRGLKSKKYFCPICDEGLIMIPLYYPKEVREYYAECNICNRFSKINMDTLELIEK